MDFIKKNFGTLFFLSGLSLLGHIASDMYLPSFPQVMADFSTTESAVALTFSIFLLGLGVGSPLSGYLSDSLGMRRSLLAGLILFIISSIGCAISSSIAMLLLCRVLQAISVSAAATIWQSIVVSRFEGAQRAAAFSILYPMVAVSPVLAPLVGSYLSSQYGWRLVFYIIAAIGCILMMVAYRKLPASEGVERGSSMVENFRKLLSDAYFRSMVLMLSFTTGAYFGYLTIIPFLLKEHGHPEWHISYFLIPSPFLFMLGGYLSPKLSAKYGSIPTLMLIALSNPLVIGITFLISGYFDGIAIFIIAMQCMSVLNGIIYPLASAEAVNRIPALSGSAAGLSGAFQSFIASLVSLAVALTIPYQMVGFATVLFASYGIALLFWWRLRRSSLIKTAHQLSL
ncbi:Bcr/CflA family efflux MFS transporter [Pedobacter sp. Du54]|uniref:Bcr/CflA family efflux MFS transporter n=1 Tax=Pedobacter anseongensis TaxID=3133439 RepID=UPI0030B2ED15